MSAPERIASGTPETVTPDRAESSSAKANPPCATPNAIPSPGTTAAFARSFFFAGIGAAEGYHTEPVQVGQPAAGNALVRRDSQSRRRVAPTTDAARSIARGSVCVFAFRYWTCRLSVACVSAPSTILSHEGCRRGTISRGGKERVASASTGIPPLPLHRAPSHARRRRHVRHWVLCRYRRRRRPFRASPPPAASPPARHNRSPLEASFFRHRGGGGRRRVRRRRVHRGRG